MKLISADLRSTCYRAMLKDGDLDVYEQMLALYRATDLHEEQDRISRSLGSIQNTSLLSKVIEFAMSVSIYFCDLFLVYIYNFIYY